MKAAARVAGALYLSLVPLGFYSLALAPSVYFVPRDAEATIRNIAELQLLFRTAIASHLISQVVVVFLALRLYRLFRIVDDDRARLMLVLALLCVSISFAAEMSSLAVLRIVDDPRLHPQAMLSLEMQRSGVLLAVFWGLWMLPLAALVFASGFLPKWLALPVVIASVCSAAASRKSDPAKSLFL